MASPPSSSSPSVRVEVRPQAGLAFVTLAKEPVNSLDLATWQQLEAALDQLEADPSVRAVVFSSGLQRDVFSAGNDLLELYAPRTSKARYSEFWITSNRFLARLHRSRLATVAAVRGACPAGGCIISLCCDHRVMTPQGSMGLNEVLLGIPVPKYWGLLMARVIGHRAAEGLLLPGKLVSPQEALRLGLVDKVVGTNDELLPAAEAVAVALAKLPAAALASTKASLRADFCREWEAYSRVEPEGAWDFLNRPDTLQTLAATLQRLSGAKGPAAKAVPKAAGPSKL